MKINLVKILWRKEKIHWNRIKEMFNKFNPWLNKLTFGLIVAVLVSLGHYVFGIAHTLFELMLFIFANKMFKSNLQKMYIVTVNPIDTKNKK
jgi:hypothetical protein